MAGTTTRSAVRTGRPPTGPAATRQRAASARQAAAGRAPVRAASPRKSGQAAVARAGRGGRGQLPHRLRRGRVAVLASRSGEGGQDGAPAHGRHFGRRRSVETPRRDRRRARQGERAFKRHPSWNRSSYVSPAGVPPVSFGAPSAMGMTVRIQVGMARRRLRVRARELGGQGLADREHPLLRQARREVARRTPQVIGQRLLIHREAAIIRWGGARHGSRRPGPAAPSPSSRRARLESSDASAGRGTRPARPSSSPRGRRASPARGPRAGPSRTGLRRSAPPTWEAPRGPPVEHARDGVGDRREGSIGVRY